MGVAFRSTAQAAFPHPAAQPAKRDLLRFFTCGSVDDGKSTLLGRLLYETGAVFEDQIEVLSKDTARFGTTGKTLDFALLVDGLAAEREQGITIDVAYRYFSTSRRAFIAADTPGHEQYTRNMATGASTADVAIVLVDARKGLLPQTRRHSYIVSLLGVRRVIVAVNKMDLVGYEAEVFNAIQRDYRALVAGLGFTEVHFVPLSAREGDNVTASSQAMPWYRGPSLLHLLETIETVKGEEQRFRFPVQWVNRPNADFRGFSGTIASGAIRVGDAVSIEPGNRKSSVMRILTPSGDAMEARAGEAITLALADEIDISRGDVISIAAGRQGKETTRTVTARLLSLGETPVEPGRVYLAKIGTKLVNARLIALHHGVDVHDYARKAVSSLPMNAIGSASLRFESEVVATAYAENATLGALLLIDTTTNEAAALGVIDEVGKGSASKPEGQPGLLLRLSRVLLEGGSAPNATADHSAAPWVGEGQSASNAAEAVASGQTLNSVQVLSWRMLAAALAGLLAGLLAGSLLAGLAAFALDFLVRPLLRRGHGVLWAKFGGVHRPFARPSQ